LTAVTPNDNLVKYSSTESVSSYMFKPIKG